MWYVALTLSSLCPFYCKTYQQQRGQNAQTQSSSTSYNPVNQKVPNTEEVSVCEVPTGQRVQCGGLFISSDQCNELGCCYQGRECYFGNTGEFLLRFPSRKFVFLSKYNHNFLFLPLSPKRSQTIVQAFVLCCLLSLHANTCSCSPSVTVHCTRAGEIIVVLARSDTEPSVDSDSLCLLGEGFNCTVKASNSLFSVFQFPVSECGTLVFVRPQHFSTFPKSLVCFERL